MRKLTLLPVLVLLLAACQQKKTLKEQLNLAFTNHLTAIEPGASVDSVRVIWSTPVNDRLSRVIDDTLYVRTYNRIKDQLAGALGKSDKDSIAFYRYELQVLQHSI